MSMQITPTMRLDFQARFVLNEDQCRALDALAGYNFESFCKVFYEKMGEHYLKPHEDGLRSLFDAIGKQIKPQLDRIDAINSMIREAARQDAMGQAARGR